MSVFGDNIKAARVAKGLTQDQLAEKIGINSGKVIWTWEKGTSRPDSEKIKRLCEFLGVSADSLMEIKTSKLTLTANEADAIKKYRALDEHGKSMVNYVLSLEYERAVQTGRKHKQRMIQLRLYDLPASAGTGLYLDSDGDEDIYVPETPLSEAADYVIRVSGDSMEPDYHDGDRVLVREQNAVEVGDVGIFILNNESYIKEFGNGYLISLNEKYKPIPLHDFDSFRCCGKVLGIVNE